jgi:DNA (cytosine-5)-methyltransferase 1
VKSVKKTEKTIKLFSFFAGAGFLDLGFEKTGFTIDFMNEISEPFKDAYCFAREKMNIQAPRYGYFTCDIKNFLERSKYQVNLEHYLSRALSDGAITGFIGGPPCPDFSIAGKNLGKEGVNGILALSYVDLICVMKPDFFLFENVKGLYQTIEHRKYFDELKQKLKNAGYCTSERLTNALEFGVPQDRDRILLFGILKDKINSTKYDSGDELVDFLWNKYASFQLDTVKNQKWPECNDFGQISKFTLPDEYKKLTIQYWFDQNDVEDHPNANFFFQPRSGLSKFQSIQEGDVSKKSYKRLHRWKYSPTAAYGNNEVHLHPYKERRLSVAEALAIQSLPKEFQLPPEMSLSDMFKTIGNGVPYLMANGVAETIKNYVQENIR